MRTPSILELVPAPRTFPAAAIIIGIHEFIQLTIRTPHHITLIAHLLTGFRAEVNEIVRIIHLPELP